MEKHTPSRAPSTGKSCKKCSFVPTSFMNLWQEADSSPTDQVHAETKHLTAREGNEEIVPSIPKEKTKDPAARLARRSTSQNCAVTSVSSGGSSNPSPSGP